MPELFGIEWSKKEEVNTGEFQYTVEEDGGYVKAILDSYGIWQWEEFNGVTVGGPAQTTLHNDNDYAVEIHEDKTVLYEMTPETENDVDFSS